MGSDGNTTLAECRHDHADDLTDTPPHEDQTNNHGNGIDQDFNDGGNRDLSGNSLDHRGEGARGDGSTSSKEHFLSKKMMGAGNGFEPIFQHY